MSKAPDEVNTELQPEQLDLRSHDVAEDRRQDLLRLFPETEAAMRDGYVDRETPNLLRLKTISSPNPPAETSHRLLWPPRR